MQKTLIALGLAAALTSFQAQAADVTLYGLVDYGFNYPPKHAHATGLADHLQDEFRHELGLALRYEGHGRPRERHEGRFRP